MMAHRAIFLKVGVHIELTGTPLSPPGYDPEADLLARCKHRVAGNSLPRQTEVPTRWRFSIKRTIANFGNKQGGLAGACSKLPAKTQSAQADWQVSSFRKRGEEFVEGRKENCKHPQAVSADLSDRISPSHKAVVWRPPSHCPTALGKAPIRPACGNESRRSLHIEGPPGATDHDRPCAAVHNFVIRKTAVPQSADAPGVEIVNLRQVARSSRQRYRPVLPRRSKRQRLAVARSQPPIKPAVDEMPNAIRRCMSRQMGAPSKAGGKGDNRFRYGLVHQHRGRARGGCAPPATAETPLHPGSPGNAAACARPESAASPARPDPRSPHRPPTPSNRARFLAHPHTLEPIALIARIIEPVFSPSHEVVTNSRAIKT